MIELPKPDKRYKAGKIVKDKHGKYRGNPVTVVPKVVEPPNMAHLDASHMSRPPILVSPELAKYIEKRL